MSTNDGHEHHDPTEHAQANLDRTRIRFLTPQKCKIHLGNLGALHVTIEGEGIYGGIYTAFAFPVGTQDGFISLLQVGRRRTSRSGSSRI